MPSGMGINLTHIYITGFDPDNVMCKTLNNGFSVCPATESSDPILLSVKRTEDGGCGVEPALGEFKNELYVLLGQILYELFIQDEYLESRIFIQYLGLSTGK